MLVDRIAPLARQRLVTIGVEALLADAAKLLGTTDINLVVVCRIDGTMAGVITKTDIVKKISQCPYARQGSTSVQVETARCADCACATQVAEVMTRNVTCCHPTDLLSDAWNTMQNHGFLHIPVLDESSRPLGVLNARDVLQAFLAEVKEEELLLRDYVMGVGYR